MAFGTLLANCPGLCTHCKFHVENLPWEHSPGIGNTPDCRFSSVDLLDCVDSFWAFPYKTIIFSQCAANLFRCRPLLKGPSRSGFKWWQGALSNSRHPISQLSYGIFVVVVAQLRTLPLCSRVRVHHAASPPVYVMPVHSSDDPCWCWKGRCTIRISRIKYPFSQSLFPIYVAVFARHVILLSTFSKKSICSPWYYQCEHACSFQCLRHMYYHAYDHESNCQVFS